MVDQVMSKATDEIKTGQSKLKATSSSGLQEVEVDSSESAEGPDKSQT